MVVLLKAALYMLEFCFREQICLKFTIEECNLHIMLYVDKKIRFKQCLETLYYINISYISNKKKISYYKNA